MTFSTTSETSSPLTLFPSTATSTSSVLMPASSAGEPCIGAATTTSPFSSSSWTPIPTYVPERLWSFCSRSSGVKKRVCPPSPSVPSIPLIAP